MLATGLSLLERYDAGSIAGDGQIQRDEYLRALEHYIDGVITKASTWMSWNSTLASNRCGDRPGGGAAGEASLYKED